MDSKPSKADPDIWMKSSRDGIHCEYIAVYVDDLAICMQDPQACCDNLKEKYKLDLRDVGPVSYHLGCGYNIDEDGTLVADPRKYETRIPLVVGDLPENDLSDFSISGSNQRIPNKCWTTHFFLDWGDLTLQYMS